MLSGPASTEESYACDSALSSMPAKRTEHLLAANRAVHNAALPRSRVSPESGGYEELPPKTALQKSSNLSRGKAMRFAIR